ncbi:shikimate kinase [Deferribacter thermophilus]|uniref:shikimate kinase n=1 Tax=Deferribacter thermophilus TaxID=53573 RepID=UPI003C2027A2
MNIYLIGFMGTGKTTVGKLLAERLNKRFSDLDDLIVQKAEKSIADIFREDGEEEFRRLETEVLKTVNELDDYVIATGGGVLTTGGNYEIMKSNGVLITLAASPEAIYERLKNDNTRPLLVVDNVLDEIKRLLFERAPLYIKADYIVDTTERAVEEIVEEIIGYLND